MQETIQRMEGALQQYESVTRTQAAHIKQLEEKLAVVQGEVGDMRDEVDAATEWLTEIGTKGADGAVKAAFGSTRSTAEHVEAELQRMRKDMQQELEKVRERTNRGSFFDEKLTTGLKAQDKQRQVREALES